MDPEPNLTAKVVLLGASDVGKSSIVLRFVKNKFFDRRENTIGAAFLTKTIPILRNGEQGEETVVVKYEIWDTAGQERYHSLAPMYYRDAQASIIVYDITYRDSFLKAQKWLEELYKSSNQKMTICLVGNKSDLPERQIEYNEGKKFAEQHNLLFFEVSAKTNDHINDIFLEVARVLIQSLPVEIAPPAKAAAVESFKVDKEKPKKKDGCC